ncbi:MAG: HEAT repeat domain-containing protein, partial [Acidobacteria bacterium]|nr:HEAT repeat domain-containing protein [Acidobacteriota bacterium]
LAETPLTSLWDADRIAGRMRELDPIYLIQHKAKVMLEVLRNESDDDDYLALVLELERALPDLIVDGQYIAAEEILKALATDLVPSSGRTDIQREAARDVLIHFCNQHTLREVVRNLAGKQRTQIDAATRIFSSLGPMAVPALLEALSQEASRPIRVHLLGMLAAIGDHALPEIRKHLRDKRWFFVRNLVWIIGEIGDARFVSHLGVIVNHPDVRVRRETVRSTAKLHHEAAIQVLLSAIEDSDHGVQLLAIRGLGRPGAHGAVERLCELLRRPNLTGNNTDIIRTAAIALGRIGSPAATPDLKKLTRRPILFRKRRIQARDAAAWALATLQGEVAGEAPEARMPQRPDDNYEGERADDEDAT